MAFLKALTVFIVCISIFKIIVSKSKLRGNITHPMKYNVFLTGSIECPSCRKYDCDFDYGYAIIYLEERRVVEYKYEYCNKTFVIGKYLDNPGIQDYNASFYLSCGYHKIKASVKNVWPKEITIGRYSVYNFSKISFSTPEKENIVREEKVLEKTIFK